MEKTARGAGGGLVAQARGARKLSARPPRRTAPQGSARGAPGPRAPLPAPDPAGSRPRPPPRRRRAPRAHCLPTRNRNWPVGGTRAMASGRGRVGGGGTGPPPSAAGRRTGSLALPRGPRREGPAPRTPEPPPAPPRRRRGRPPRPGAESRLLHRSPPPRDEGRRGDGQRLGAASRGFKDNNKKMATTQSPRRPPPLAESAPAPGGGGRRLPERGAGSGPPSTPLRPETQVGAQGATRGLPRRPHSPGVWSAGTSCSGRESSKPI